jgi:aryl sulfotransferase
MQQSSAIVWPTKTRDIHNHHMKSTVWDTFTFREGDTVVATYAKSGTTWMQQIVSQLIFDGKTDVDVHQISPWIDLRIMPPEAIAALDTQTHRRVIKTHLPVDALVFSPKARYIYIGRDGRDAVWSLYNHHINATDDYFAAFRETPGLVGPVLERGNRDAHGFYLDWFNGDGFPYWSFWENVRSWWAIRHLPNVHFIHFNDMKADLPGAIRRIAGFLDIPVNEATFPAIVDHCSFDYMKSHAVHMAPLGGQFWNGGAGTFINKGTNGRWRETLTASEIAAYDKKAKSELGADCARWLSAGGKVD